MKGDVSLPMTSSSSGPCRDEDAPLRDQPQHRVVSLWGEHGAGESFPAAQMVPNQSKEQKGGVLSLWQFHRLIPTLNPTGHLWRSSWMLSK